MEMTENKYKNSQQECVNEHEGKWLVIAGPGTGKTYTVVERIKNMIEKGIEPESILCLTFSDTAAKEMKIRVGEDCPVNVFTFHGFCLNIIQEYPEDFEFENLNVILDSHKRTLIGECIDELNPKAYKDEKGDSYKFIKDILDGIDEIKKNRINEDEYYSAIKNNPLWEPYLNECQKELDDFNNGIKTRKKKSTLEKQVNDAQLKVDKAKELWTLYSIYSQKMKDADYIDFNDMIDIVLKKFEDENSDLLETVCEKYKYVIVDEYQDTNTSQNEIVFNLAKYCPNIFVVGDDDQIIYTFQGAHLDTIEKFLKRFNNDKDKVKVRCFDKNYRSTQSILDFADKLAQIQDTGFCKFMLSKSGLNAEQKRIYQTTSSPKTRLLSKFEILDDNGQKIIKKLYSAEDSKVKNLDKPINVSIFHNPDDERDFIVNRIINIKKEQENSDKKLSQIAILTRTNKELKDYANYLKANGIPVEITGGKNIFEINSVNVLITYMQFLINPEKYTDKILSYLLLQPFHIDPRDYKTICGIKNRYDSVVSEVENLVNKCSTEDEFKQKIENIILNFHKNALIYNIEKLIKSEKQIVYGKEKLKKFIDTYKYLREYITGENYKNSILVIGERTGIFNYYFCKDSINKLENIRGIKKLIETADVYFDVHKDSGNSFSMFVEYLTKIIEGDIEIKLDKPDEPLNAVQLSTYHSSKGREFEYVFMPTLTKGVWESSSSSYKDIIPVICDESDTIETLDEKNSLAKFLDNIKLLYVGITRAKHSLYLSYTKTNDTKYGKISAFFEDLTNDDFIRENKLNVYKKEYEMIDISENYEQPAFEYDYKKEFCDYIPNSFSPKAINTYKNCPKQYFYNYILQLSGEGGIDDSAAFGTSMHAAFEYAIKQVMNTKKYPDYDEVYNIFEQKLDEAETENPNALKQSAKEKIFSKGGYYDEFKALAAVDEIDSSLIYDERPKINSLPTGKHTIYAEFPLSYEMNIPKEWNIPSSEDKKIILKGFIDRLDKNPDGEFYIYDYKSRESCSSISPGDNYFCQMALYKYIFENQIEGSKVTKESFLLPLEKNGNKEHDLSEKFEKIIKDKNITNYENTIDNIFECIKGIYNLNFDVSKSPNCTYCGLKQFCTSKTI